MIVGDWIRDQRAKRTPPNNTQLWLAEQMGVAQTTISKWEKGKSEVSRDELARLELVLGSSFPTEKNATLRQALTLRVPVMGYVRARQAIEKATPDGLEYIEAPPGTPEGSRAVIIRGLSLPPFNDGTALIFWAFATDPAIFLGELCWVHLTDGTEHVRTIARGSAPGTWSLLRGPGEPPMRDVEVAELAPIEMTVRRPQWITPA